MTETVERVKAYMTEVSEPVTIEAVARKLRIKDEVEVKEAISTLFKMQMIDLYPAAKGVQSRYKTIKPDLKKKLTDQ